MYEPGPKFNPEGFKVEDPIQAMPDAKNELSPEALKFLEAVDKKGSPGNEKLFNAVNNADLAHKIAEENIDKKEAA